MQLVTRTMAEHAATARRHPDESRRRLRTDVIDLWQLHDVRSPAQAERRVAGVQAMETLGGDGFVSRPGRPGVIPDLLSVEQALQFVRSLPVHTLVSGMARVEHLRENAATARAFTSMAEQTRQPVIERVAPLAASGAMEQYKADR